MFQIDTKHESEIFFLIFPIFNLSTAKGEQQGMTSPLPRIINLSKGDYLANIKALTGYRLGIDCGTPRNHDFPLSTESLETLIREASLLGINRTIS
mgnify:CR=1 FL=1